MDALSCTRFKSAQKGTYNNNWQMYGAHYMLQINGN